MQFDRTIVSFFVLFLSVYFLESIGGFFMTSAIVSIEKQFQIPSKISGMMVSAGDFGYIPSVVFVSYLGGKGNRAKWIGGGCVLIAVSNLVISASNFLFPVETVSLNTSVLQASIERDIRRFNVSSNSLDKFLSQLSPEQKEGVRQRFPASSFFPVRNSATTKDLTSLVTHYEKSWLSQFEYCDELEAKNRTDVTCQAFYNFLSLHNAATKEDVDNLRMLSATSYAFCDVSLNRLRNMIQSIRCTKDVSNLGPTVTIFLGLLFLGVGRTMPFSLGLPLIDDNVRKKNLPIYFAGMFFIRIMGPVVGFMMGSFFNKFYYTGIAPRGITPRDPMWIGMWWGGFLVIGLVLFGPSVALFCFKAPQPDKKNKEEEESSSLENGNGEDKNTKINGEKKLLDSSGLAPLALPEGTVKKPSFLAPAKKKSRGLALVDRHIEKGVDGNTVVPESLEDKVKDFAQTISTVIREPVYAGTLAGRILDVMAFKGFFIFLPKYLELQFGIPQYKINAYMGIIGVVGFAIGILIGSVALKIWKLEGRKVAVWVAVCSGLAACLSFMNASVGCRSTLTALGEALPNNFNVNSSCLSGCGCAGAPLYPVCDTKGTVYYSPCHAGCRLNAFAFSALNPKLTPTFSDCRCSGSENVSREFCEDSDCEYKVKWYFANMAIGGIVGGMGVIPGVLIMLRSVPPKHRSVSLGFNGFLVSLFATLPSPIIWGAIIDHFCIYWDLKCDGKGACSLYATDRLRVWLHFIYGAIRLISLITDVFVIYHAKGLKITDSALDEDEKESKDAKENRDSKEGKENQHDYKKKAAKEIGTTDEKKPLNESPTENKKEELLLHMASSQLGSRKSVGSHSRSPSRDYTGQSTKMASRKQSDEMNLLRKSSNHIAGSISEL